jgi:hypothetical protein
MRKVYDFFWNGVDARVYALVRIAVAFGGLANLVDLWPRRQMYFSSSGMISLEAVRFLSAGKYHWSIFYAVTSEAGVTAVFLAAGAALVALGLGLGSRVAAALVLAWSLSYSDRAFPVLHGWDAVLRSYTFLVFVSPLGRVWSVDRLLWPRERDGDDVPVYGLRLMQWQLFILFTTTVWLKVPDPFWRTGQVLAYFGMSQYSRNPDDLFMVRHEWVSAIGTYLTLATELGIPWLLWFRRTRPVGLLAGFGLHLSIATQAKLGVFSLCMIGPYLAFLERADVDWLVTLTRARSARELKACFVGGEARSIG